ncbi:MAG: FG-GAP repeat protein [Planctomycetes bacterium]|nr:FG-GAP repeat protein [Planctomycetota bacterium]
MRHLMPLLAAAASVLSTAPAYADLGDQLAKLLPNDGAAGDRFGTSVEISGAPERKSPSSGATGTTTTAPTPAPPTSLMLPALLLARGTSTRAAGSASPTS